MRAFGIWFAVAALALAHCGRYERGSEESDAGAAGLDAGVAGLATAGAAGERGASCEPCANGMPCIEHAGCASFACVQGVCADEHCDDGVVDGEETDVDCGGPSCRACPAGSVCEVGSDCESRLCRAARCLAPSCDDAVLNGSETDVDCGGDLCAPCRLHCTDRNADCDGQYDNGCEIDIGSEVNDCGACGRRCSLAHATPECVEAQCRIATCERGFADCDDDPRNGCEIDLTADPANCSACGSMCVAVNGAPSCVEGTCQIECASDFDDCDESRENGCETRTSNDPNNCGTCGVVCPAMMGDTPICIHGLCPLAL